MRKRSCRRVLSPLPRTRTRMAARAGPPRARAAKWHLTTGKAAFHWLPMAFSARAITVALLRHQAPAGFRTGTREEIAGVIGCADPLGPAQDRTWRSNPYTGKSRLHLRVGSDLVGLRLCSGGRRRSRASKALSEHGAGAGRQPIAAAEHQWRVARSALRPRPDRTSGPDIASPDIGRQIGPRRKAALRYRLTQLARIRWGRRVAWAV